jgi:hypothetical protein
MFESQYFNVRQDELQKHMLELRSAANKTAEIISFVIMDTNKSLKRVAKFRYLRMIRTNQNCIHEQIKNILNSANTSYNSFRIFVFPAPMYKSKC